MLSGGGEVSLRQPQCILQAAQCALAVSPAASPYKRDLVAWLQETIGVVAEMGDCTE